MSKKEKPRVFTKQELNLAVWVFGAAAFLTYVTNDGLSPLRNLTTITLGLIAIAIWVHSIRRNK